MSDSLGFHDAAQKGSRLADAIREVKNAVADRDDVVVDIREAQRTRLELLAEELKPVFADVPGDDDRFDFAISAGAQPRLWIDCVAHVTMARDRRTYRFLRDTRLGRVVLAESAEMRPVADQVTRYIAERVIERRRVLEGDLAPVDLTPAGEPEATETTARSIPAESAAGARAPATPDQTTPAGQDALAAQTAMDPVPPKRSSVWRGLAVLLLGIAVGTGLVLVFARDRLGEFGVNF